MTASDAESWAKLRLVQGESSAESWELVSSSGHTTLTVGSGNDCTWVVREDGVRPLHFSLHWDGSTLRVADVYSAGDVRVDGALLTSQWRPLVGRVRIDFGNAALVVETSTKEARLSDHPLDLGEPRERPKSSTPPRKGVETLIGVAPLNKIGTPAPAAPLQGYVPGRSDAPSASPSEAPRAARNGADRSMKATLVGGISSLPPSIQVVDTTGSPSGPPSAGGGPKPNATLMGFGVADALRGAVGTQPAVRVGAGGYEPDPRTAPSYPPAGGSAPPGPSGSQPPGSRRMTQQGHGVPPASQPPEAARPSNRAPGQERIGSAWQEDPTDPSFGTERAEPSREREAAPRERGRTQRDFAERLSDIPTQMRDPTTFSSKKRPAKGIPWRFVGIGVLTLVAYFAWLYLLDHF